MVEAGQPTVAASTWLGLALGLGVGLGLGLGVGVGLGGRRAPRAA